jgi:hypothetical protein
MWRHVSVLLICLLGTEARAAVMECREWQPGATGAYLGSYVFSFDSKTKVLSVSYKPDSQWNFLPHILFGGTIRRWRLIFENEGRAVFYGIDDDVFGPVKLLSLDFGKATMFNYSFAGISEDSGLEKGETRKQCRRLD